MILVTRPVNALICGLSVFCGGILRGRPLEEAVKLIESFSGNGSSLWFHGESYQSALLYAVLSAALILAAGNAFNDVCDRDCDRINAPHRPIPSGMVTSVGAVIIAAVLAVLGLVLAVPIGIAGFATAASAVVLLAAYDLKLKRMPLAGNVAVALLGGLAFVYGGIAGRSVSRALVPAVFAVLFHFGRELIKDAADVRGDRVSGIRTAATVWGTDTTCRIAAAALMVLAVLTVSPFTFGFFGFGYLLIVVLCVWPVLVYASISPLRNPSERTFRRVSLILKIDMPVGIAAVLTGFQGF